jgi:hypothetical protein
LPKKLLLFGKIFFADCFLFRGFLKPRVEPRKGSGGSSMISTKTKRLSVILSAATLLSAAVGASVIGSAKAEPSVEPVVAPTILREASTSTVSSDKFVAYGNDYYSSNVNHYVIDEADAIGNFTYTLSSDGTYYTITGWSTGNLKTQTDLNRDLFVFPSNHSNGTTVLPVKAVDISSSSSSASLASNVNNAKIVFGSGIESIRMSNNPYYFASNGNSGSSNRFYLSLPDTLTDLSSSSTSHSFLHCSSGYTTSFSNYLLSVEFPDGLKTIGDFTFYESLGSLKSIDFPSSLTTIGERAFGETSISELDLPSSVVSIGADAFSNSTALVKVSSLGSVSTIPSHCFYGDTALTYVTLPKDLVSISSYSFDGCVNLASISVPDSVQAIGDHAFDGTSLSYFAFPSNLGSMGMSSLPSSVKSVLMYTTFAMNGNPFAGGSAYAPLTSVFWYGSDVSVAQTAFNTVPQLTYAKNWYAYSLEENADGAHFHMVDGYPVIWKAGDANNPTNSSTSSSTDTKTDQKDSDESILMKALSIAGIAVVGLVALLLLMKVCKSFFKVIS